MVFFCPDCTYSLGISKSLAFSSEVENEKKEVKTVIEALKLLDKNLNEYKAIFNKNDLEKNKKYQKLNQNDKNKLNLLFKSNISEADLSCSNCGYKKQIEETVKLYEFNVMDNTKTVNTLEDNKLLTLDPILPRTRDYVCKNVNCITHKDPNIREAVFMKIPKSYNLTYICCVCHYSWNLV
tara:strand:+ start:2580 stop:3122 length:543 start_codon:yes stop_codon:yes gene_type:complete